jgi:pimeloyl-ACP methyl ester carboxylesterase
MTLRYAYLHGFASSPLAHKAVFLAARFRDRGADLRTPDLNHPSFGKKTIGSSLSVIDELAAERNTTWRLIGSSMGGYLAARWAALHPTRVDRLLLLCPGFDLGSRLSQLLGEEAMAKWARDQALALPDPTGALVPVHWNFMAEIGLHPPWPAVPCPTRIVHGTRDDVVPLEGSRRYAAQHELVEVVEVDDDHGLLGSLSTIERIAMEFILEGRGLEA